MDFVATVEAYLNEALAPELGSSPDVPKVFFDAAPDVGMPFIVFHDLGEKFPVRDSTGCFVSDGMLQFNVKAVGREQSKLIGLRLMRVLSDNIVDLAISEGKVEWLWPEQAYSTPLLEVVPDGPTAAERTVVMRYRIVYASA